jgi:hypothetical protein
MLGTQQDALTSCCINVSIDRAAGNSGAGMLEDPLGKSHCDEMRLASLSRIQRIHVLLMDTVRRLSRHRPQEQLLWHW